MFHPNVQSMMLNQASLMLKEAILLGYSSLSLRDVFNEMDAGVFFDTDADFSTRTNYTNGVFFKDAEHKAKIRIDEEGN
jgi:Serpin (serine protease inhibitor)